MPGGVVLALFVQHFDLQHQRRQVVRRQAQGIVQRLLRLLEFGVVQVQPGQLILVFGALRLALEHQLPGIDGLLQRPEIQAEFIRGQPQQRIDSRQPHVLFAVVEQWPQQKTALAVRYQGADAPDRGDTHFGRLVLQVGIRQFQGHRAWIIGQLGMQPDTALGGQVRTLQLLIEHPRSTWLTAPGRCQRFAVTVLDGFGNHRGGIAQGKPCKADDEQGEEADKQIAAGLGHAKNPGDEASAKECQLRSVWEGSQTCVALRCRHHVPGGRFSSVFYKSFTVTVRSLARTESTETENPECLSLLASQASDMRHPQPLYPAIK
ncbi:hypothetical protein D3C80_670510 [compost metagenome]